MERAGGKKRSSRRREEKKEEKKGGEKREEKKGKRKKNCRESNPGKLSPQACVACTIIIPAYYNIATRVASCICSLAVLAPPIINAGVCCRGNEESHLAIHSMNTIITLNMAGGCKPHTPFLSALKVRVGCLVMNN